MITIESIIKNTWREFSGHFGQWILLALPIIVASTLASIIISLMIPSSEEFGPAMFGAVVETAVTSIMLLWFTIVVIINADRLLSGQTIDILATYREALKRYLRVLWVAVLLLLVVLGGTLLLVIPGILLALRYGLAIPAAILEDKRGWAAMRRSHELTRGRLGTLFSLLFVPGIVFGFFVIIATILTMAAFSFLGAVVGIGLPYPFVDNIIAYIGTIMLYLVTIGPYPLQELIRIIVFRDFKTSTP